MVRNRKIEEQPLSDYWKPPAGSNLKNGVGEPVSCMATTFEFDASFFELELLPRFLGLRFDHTENERTFIIEREEALAKTRVGVLVDASLFDPRQTTLQWDQLPIQVPGGIQHAKLTLLVWERLIRLIAGSANLTRQGYRRNRELFATLDFFDSSDSAPLNLLGESLDFTETLCGWSRALPAATQRIREMVEQIRVRTRQWSNAPQNFKPRERPRVDLIFGHPKQKSSQSRSVLNQVIQMWLPRRVNQLVLMTPFFGQGVDNKDPVLSRLFDLPIARDAEGWLVAPQILAPEGIKECIVALPNRFKEYWEQLFGKYAYVLPIPLYVEGVDERPRDLHAKAILIQGDNHDLLLIGSSNFTPHGMGIGAFNCEANLVFENWADAKQEGVVLKDRLGLPVPWNSSIEVNQAVWQESGQKSEDTPSCKPHLPAFFAWASYSQKTGEIRVGVNRGQPEPSDWTIGLSGYFTEKWISLFSLNNTSKDVTELCFTIDEKSRNVHLIALRVSWLDVSNSRYEGFLAVAVEDRDSDILPPEEFRNLTLDGIIECLLSGRTPAGWVEKQHTLHKRSSNTDAAIESLHAVDTSEYMTYRMRRFGRALAAMAGRIARTPPTPDAIRYRLLRDPLGPVHFAETLFCSRNGSNSKNSHMTETGYRLFTLAEMVLAVGHVGRYIRDLSGQDEKWIMPLFCETREIFRMMVQRIQDQAGPLPKDLSCYLDAAFSENAQLLNIKEEE